MVVDSSSIEEENIEVIEQVLCLVAPPTFFFFPLETSPPIFDR